MTSTGGRALSHRLAALEDRAVEQAARREAGRIGAIVGADPEVLLARAQEIARVIEQDGYEHAVEILAHRSGTSAEWLAQRATALAPDRARPPCH